MYDVIGETSVVACCGGTALLQVPESCMYDVIGEFLESPELAYTQHYTEPFAEQSRNYW